jgi:hypothetical protein
MTLTDDLPLPQPIRDRHVGEASMRLQLHKNDRKIPIATFFGPQIYLSMNLENDNAQQT